jgi:ribosomal protein S17
MAVAKNTASSSAQTVTIKPPNFGIVEFTARGQAPLVIHRFSAKTKAQMKQKMETGKAASSKKNREAKATDDLYEEARYRSAEGWDGFNASAVRAAMISACRLVGFKMTLAKLSVFVEADGVDAIEPQIPLIRIYGDPVKQEDMARVETGQPYVTVRAAYHHWSAKIRIRFDADQFTLQDVSNLMARVGLQVGIGEGRPDSKNSAGMGWGLFTIEEAKEGKAA